jgi:dolichol-phosphate mannosyltransferase
MAKSDLAREINLHLGIVSPIANEGAASTRFVVEVLKQCARWRDVSFFSVLDRATTDNSLALLRELAASEPRLKVVGAPDNQCVVDAYIRGYREALAARTDWILEMGAGFSHQPEDHTAVLRTHRPGQAL